MKGAGPDKDYEIVRLPMVEEEKSIELVLKVCEAMKKFNIPRRNSPVIAIGGGVCLDVVGLAATMFRRKTPYIRVPTTTLSYVDASVGAKSGVNFMGSKNRLGAYVPPVAALLDSQFLRVRLVSSVVYLSFLNTLPLTPIPSHSINNQQRSTEQTEEKRAVASGVSEMSKMALMKSPELFSLLEEHATQLVANRFQPAGSTSPSEGNVPARVLQLSIETMLEELAPNLWENSLDRLVDFGHAIGQELEMHALGTEHEVGRFSWYQRFRSLTHLLSRRCSSKFRSRTTIKLTHGESVNVDMTYMTILASARGLISSEEQTRILKMLSSYGCPTWSPLMTRDFLVHALDERRKLSMGLRLPLPTGIGKAAVFHNIDTEECLDALETFHMVCGPAGNLSPSSSTSVASSTIVEE